MSSHTTISAAELSDLLHKVREAIAEERNAQVERLVDEEVADHLSMMPECLKRWLGVKPLAREVAYERIRKRGDGVLTGPMAMVRPVGWGAEHACKQLQALCDLAPRGM